MNLYDLIITDKTNIRLDAIFLEDSRRRQLTDLIKEHRYIGELHALGLPVANKILLHGCSGCGKTTTAKAVAAALGRPLLVLNLANIVCARIGETAQNIRQVFEKAARDQAVLFLDEFDQIGKTRESDDREVGEMRRLVNTLIQLIDYYPEKALLICATNYAAILDKALMRRFQLQIHFELPDPQTLDAYYDQLLAPFPDHLKTVPRKYGISFAEARDHMHTAVKSRIIAALEQPAAAEANAGAADLLKQDTAVS